jgi:glycosyltransferase involved in cell wall biosynthesis
MSLGVPVVIKGAGAIPETVGNGALVLPSDAGPILASEALHAVLTNDELRGSLINAGYQRVSELEQRTSSHETAQLLKSVVS